jgi:hypothetical protein
MDILSGREALEAFEREFTEDLKRDQAEWTPGEYRGYVRLTARQAAFAEQFSERAPDAWVKLKGLTGAAFRWLNAEIEIKTGNQASDSVMRRTVAARELNASLHAWASDHGIDVPWVHFISLMTVRAFALHAAFQLESPKSLLFNVYPFLIIDNDQAELGHTTISERYQSVITVSADQGMQQWNTLEETRGKFKKRVLAAYEAALDAQLDAVEDVVVAADSEVHWHWIGWTIERYAGKKSIRAIHNASGTSRPGVSKAIENTRVELGFAKLPEDWGATATK